MDGWTIFWFCLTAWVCANTIADGISKGIAGGCVILANRLGQGIKVKQ